MRAQLDTEGPRFPLLDGQQLPSKHCKPYLKATRCTLSAKNKNRRVPEEQKISRDQRHRHAVQDEDRSAHPQARVTSLSHLVAKR